MKSKQMFQTLLDTLRGTYIELAKTHETIDRHELNTGRAFDDGYDSREDEVAELTYEVNRLVNEVHELVEQVNYMESKLRDQHLDSYNAGVQTGRESEVTKATVKMSDAAARTIFAGERVR